MATLLLALGMCNWLEAVGGGEDDVVRDDGGSAVVRMREVGPALAAAGGADLREGVGERKVRRAPFCLVGYHVVTTLYFKHDDDLLNSQSLLFFFALTSTEH